MLGSSMHGRHTPTMIGGRSLLTLAASLAAMRALVHFAVVGRLDDVSNIAMLDLTALLVMMIGRYVLPPMGDYFGSVVIAFVATLLPLAGMGWVLETFASAHVSLLGLFMGLIGIGTGGVAGTPVRSIQMVIALPVLVGGCYGLSQSHSVVLDVVLLATPYVITAVIAVAIRYRKAPPHTEVPQDF